MPWGPKTLKTSEVSRPVPSPHTVSPASHSGHGTASLFRDHLATSIPVNALAEPHTCQFSPALLWARLVPSPWGLLLAAVSRYPALAAALPHRGRSLAFLGEPSLPFGALTGGSLFSRPKERCRRRVTPSPCRPLCSLLPFHFYIQRSCGFFRWFVLASALDPPWPSTCRVP